MTHSRQTVIGVSDTNNEIHFFIVDLNSSKATYSFTLLPERRAVNSFKRICHKQLKRG